MKLHLTKKFLDYKKKKNISGTVEMTQNYSAQFSNRIFRFELQHHLVPLDIKTIVVFPQPLNSPNESLKISC